MPSFEFLDDKQPHKLDEGDMIMHQDRFWRVVKNYSILGYPTHTRRMLMILPHQFEPTKNGYKFLEITSESRIAAYRKTE